MNRSTGINFCLLYLRLLYRFGLFALLSCLATTGFGTIALGQSLSSSSVVFWETGHNVTGESSLFSDYFSLSPTSDTFFGLGQENNIGNLNFDSAENFQGMVIRGQANNNAYWSSNSNPYSSTTSTYLAQNPASAAPAPAVIAPPISSSSSSFTEPVKQISRFCSNFSFNYTYICRGSNNNGLGAHEFRLASEFNIPCSLIPPTSQAGNGIGFIYIAPEFGLQLWSSPNLWPGSSSCMPAQTFDGSLGIGVKPQITRDLSTDFWFQIGLGSTFKKVTTEAVFYRGRATGTLAITEDKKFFAHGGVMYLGRNHLKLIPVAGVIWRPNNDNTWHLVFPNPRLVRFLGKLNEVDWRGYVQGQIGGGRWLVQEGTFDGDYNTDYNDYRLGIGLSCETSSGFNGYVEIGGSFWRELYAKGQAYYKPANGFYVNAGLRY